MKVFYMSLCKVERLEMGTRVFGSQVGIFPTDSFEDSLELTVSYQPFKQL